MRPAGFTLARVSLAALGLGVLGTLSHAATVVEYSNRNDFPGSPGGQYFYSADGPEQASVDLGAVGAFFRTGRTFQTGGTTPVCRFYGSVTPGPNSHFFTVDANECNALKAAQIVPTPTNIQQWNFERNEYLTTPPTVSADPASSDLKATSCPAGTMPVLRAYNNAFPLVGPKNPWNSNHRFVRAQADINRVVAQGWRAEGTVFCVPNSPTTRQFASEAFLAGRCVAPRTDPAYGDQQGTKTAEMAWVRSYVDETYLWYADVPDIHPADFAFPEDYFAVLKTPNRTASGRALDRFHFYYDTPVWEALSQGTEFGYGWEVSAVSLSPPRQYYILYTEPNSPAGAANVQRGAQILTVDGADLVNGTDLAVLNRGLFPSTAGETHTFTIRDANSAQTRTITLVSGNVTFDPVPTVKTLDVADGKVGYLLFNDHNLPSEGRLITAISQLQAAGVRDLFLDLRYNGGGYVFVASELAYMIAGRTATAGKIFEKFTFNDKRSADTNDPSNTYPFFDAASGITGTNTEGDAPLPTLNLSRVFVITSSSTASASESVINGLQGIGLQVIRIGTTTYGKPYGFTARDNCGVTYFSVEFKGTNQLGFGDYDDGFAPTCTVTDDLNHALGDAGERRLAAALSYRQTGTCAPAAGVVDPKALGAEPKMFRSPARENRILLKR
jgi:hypothetical protein